MLRAFALATLATVALSAAGCGGSSANRGSDGRGASGAAPVSAHEWKAVIRDAYDGIVEHPHRCAAVQSAIAHLPVGRTYDGGAINAIRSYERVVCALPRGARPPGWTEVPSNHGRTLDDALRRLHAAGLRATFPAASTPCGDGLPGVDVQSPRAPARARRGSTVELRYAYSPIPSPAAPRHHRAYVTVPRLVGLDATAALGRLTAIWPCVSVRAATSTAAYELVVVAQSPRAGTQVPAFGVRVGGGYRPTTMRLTLAAP